MSLHYKIYFFSLLIIHIFYGLVFLGIFATVPKYVYVWNIVVQIGLCLFLLFQYHPFRSNYVIERQDASMIFGASLLLLINTSTLPFLHSYLQYITEPIHQTVVDPIKQSLISIDELRL